MGLLKPWQHQNQGSRWRKLAINMTASVTSHTPKRLHRGHPVTLVPQSHKSGRLLCLTEQVDLVAMLVPGKLWGWNLDVGLVIFWCCLKYPQVSHSLLLWKLTSMGHYSPSSFCPQMQSKSVCTLQPSVEWFPLKSQILSLSLCLWGLNTPKKSWWYSWYLASCIYDNQTSCKLYFR